VGSIDCDIEAIQQVIEIETVPSPKEKKKRATEKVSRRGRKLLPILGEQREARRQRSKVERKSKRESKLESRNKDVQEVTEVILTKRRIPKSKLSSVCQELQQSDILARVLCIVEADNVHFSTFPARSFIWEYASTCSPAILSS